MKLKHLLVMAGVALIVPNAFAYYKVCKSIPQRSFAGAPLYYQQSAELNPLNGDANGSKWACRSYTGADEPQTLQYMTKDDDGEIVDKPINSNGMAGGAKREKGTFDKDATTGIWGITTVSAGTYRFQYSFATDNRPDGRALDGMKLQVITQNVAGDDADRIKVRVCVSPSKYENSDDGQGKVYHWAMIDMPAVKNSSEIQGIEATGVYNEIIDFANPRVKVVDVVFENVKEGDRLAVVSMEGIFDPAKFFVIPTIKAGKSDGSDYVIHVQAEDFDEPWINGRVAHSPVFGTYEYGTRTVDEDRNVAIPSSNGVFCHFGADEPGDALWRDDWGNEMPNRYYAEPQCGAVVNMHQHEDWGAYYGEYLDETSNKVSFDQAADNFGAWLEYTFDAEEDMNLDISFRTACNWGPFTIIKTIGSSVEGKSREEGGFEVEGLEGGYLQQYSHALRVFYDGFPLRTNWDVYPKYVPGMTEEEFVELAKTPQNWTNYQEHCENGEMLNSHILHLFPWIENVNAWDHYEKWQLVKKHAADPNVPAKVASRAADAPTSYIRPDYADIPVEKGRHTIKVQSLGGQWSFDDMKFAGKPKTWVVTGVETVGSDAEKAENADAPIEIYNLQGVRMPNEAQLAPGIYVKRQGQQVVKFVVR